MQNIDKHIIYEECKKDILKLKEYLQIELHQITFVGAVAFGSIIRNEKTSSKYSDIDIVAYSPLFSRETAEKWIRYIYEHTESFYDKPPIFIEDHVTARIEYSILFEQTIFDISIFPTELSGYLHRYTNTIHDRLEVVIGSMYLNAYLLFGVIPFESLLQEQFIPFYSDDLRDARLDQLKKRLCSCLNKLELAILNNEEDLLFQIYKTRSYLIRWMFIRDRKYPFDCNRYLERQLSDLGVSNETINHLLLRGESLRTACMQFVDTAKSMLLEERQEKI